MPLSRPHFMRQTSAPADLPMASTEVSRNNTLRTLSNLQRMGYRNVWVRCDDLSANILSTAWAGGWRVCDAQGNQVRLTLDSITPPESRSLAAGEPAPDVYEAPRIAAGALQTEPLPPAPPFVAEARRGASPDDPHPAHRAAEPIVFRSPFGGDETPRASSRLGGRTPKVSSPLVRVEEGRSPSPTQPMPSPGLSRGSRVYGHGVRPQSPGGVTPSAHLTGRWTPSLKVQSPDASRPSTIISEQSVGYFNFKPPQSPDVDILSGLVPQLEAMGTHAGLRTFGRPESVASSYSDDMEASEDSFGFDRRASDSSEDEARTIRFDAGTPTIMLTGVRRPSAPTFIALPSPGLVRTDRMGSDPTGAKLKNRPAMRIRWPNLDS